MRNAAGGIVQLVFGEDGLDPVGMEARDGGPVDLPRAVQVVSATAQRPAGGALAGLTTMLSLAPAELARSSAVVLGRL